MTKKLSESRISHYLTLAGMLLLFAAGGLVTLNCNPESIPSGRVVQEVNHVQSTSNGSAAFISNERKELQYVLPSQLRYGGKLVDVTWEPTNPQEATMSGNTATIPKRGGIDSVRSVGFKGTYKVNNTTRETSYYVRVKNLL